MLKKWISRRDSDWFILPISIESISKCIIFKVLSYLPIEKLNMTF